jgi:thiamine-monophosphate kinase
LRILRRDPTDLSALAQRHRRPRARTDIAVRLAEIGATAMMDISDGLLLDAHRMATASNLGIELVEIPIVTGATEDDALSGGEDYELLFSVAESDLVANDLLALGCRQIGRLVADSRVRVLRGHTFEPSGWSHHW